MNIKRMKSNELEGLRVRNIFEIKNGWIFLSSLVVIGVAAMLWNVSSWFIEQQQKRKV
ncbi:hypothetical protein [Carnobacterium maltaromaticum]|uniref:hypothetical protein n=1 Tax=Carnobacterium maltaromaticum TaxID=2751 RepID=UPI00165C7C10|nr:hypothetical protein [Carnobacterium maltaromaticum]MBC9788598.1 hypothetical protein [Carnobacterium maltaromaticum]